MELIRRLVFVGAEYEGYLSPDPTEYSNPIMVKDLTDHFVSFADSEISVERDGVTGTMTKVAYSLKFAKNDETLFLKECYERFITKGRGNYPRKGYDTMQVKWIGTQKEFSTLTANGYNEGDIAWVVDGRLMECKVGENSGDNYWATASPSMGYVNPNTIVYCVDIINNRGHEGKFCAYINPELERVSMDKLQFFGWSEMAPRGGRVYYHEHDYFSAPDDGNERMRGEDFGGAMPLQGTQEMDLRNIEDLMSNKFYMHLNSDIKLMLGFATDESAERPNLSAYKSLKEFAENNNGEFIRLFTIKINWESYKETKDYIEFEASNPSLQSLLKSEGDTQFDIDINNLEPEYIAIDKTIDIPLYGDHTFPVYDTETGDGVRQSIMSTTSMEGRKYYFPNVSFGDITGLDSGLLQPLTFGDQTGEDVWSRIRNRPEKEYLLKNTKEYPITVNIVVPYFKCHVNYRRERGTSGHWARVCLLKGRHDAGDKIDGGGGSGYLPLKYYARNFNGNPSPDGTQSYTDMQAGDYWYDTDNKIVRVRQESGEWFNVTQQGEPSELQLYSNSKVAGQPPAKPNEPRDTIDGNNYILYAWNGTELAKADVVEDMDGMQNGNYVSLHDWKIIPGTDAITSYYYHADLQTSEDGNEVRLNGVTLQPHEEICFCLIMNKVNFESNESYSSHFYVYSTDVGKTEEDNVGSYPRMYTYLSSNHKAKTEDRYHGLLNGEDTAIIKGCYPINAVEYIVREWSRKFGGEYKAEYIESLNDVILRYISIDAPNSPRLHWETTERKMYCGSEEVTPLENSNVYYEHDGYLYEYSNGNLNAILDPNMIADIKRKASHPKYNFMGEEVMYSGYHRIKDGFDEQNLGVIPLLVPVESLNGKSDPKLHISMKELLKWFKVSGYEYSIETDGNTGADTLVIAPREYFFDYRFYPIRPRNDFWSEDDWISGRYMNGWDDISETHDDIGDYQGKIPIEENTTIGNDYAVLNGTNNGDTYDKNSYTWKRPELHERGDVTLKANKSLCYNEIVIGYEKEDYENLVGTNDPVSTFRYSTGYVTADEKKTYEMSTKIRMDFYGMMYWLIRSYSEDYDKSNDKTFCLDCKRMPSVHVYKTNDKDPSHIYGHCSLSIWDKIVIDANIVQDEYKSKTKYYNALRTPYMLMKLMNRRLGLIFSNELEFVKSENFTPSTGAGAYVDFKCNEPSGSPFHKLIEMSGRVTDNIELRMFGGEADYCPPLFTLGTATLKVGANRMLWANLNAEMNNWDSGDVEYVLSLLERPNEMIRFVDDDYIVRYGFINKHSFCIYNYKEGEIEMLLCYPRKKLDSDELIKELMLPPTNKQKL